MRRVSIETPERETPVRAEARAGASTGGSGEVALAGAPASYSAVERITRDTIASWLCVDCGKPIADVARAVLLDGDEAIHGRCAVRVRNQPETAPDLHRRLLDGIR